jgi:hypothetical protein
MIGGLYQAIPGRLQVAVPVRDIWSGRIKVRGKKSRCKHEGVRSIYPLLVLPAPCDARARLGNGRTCP